MADPSAGAHSLVFLEIQGVNDELQPRLTQALAYAAARYGHVMHPENAHEPAVACAEALLGGVGRGWADRVFFSADGCALTAHEGGLLGQKCCVSLKE